MNQVAGVEETRYEDTSTMLNADHEEDPIWFAAVPLYDDDGEFTGVIKLVQDRTDSERREAVEVLVGEVTATLGAIGDGDLSARADRPANADEVTSSPS